MSFSGKDRLPSVRELALARIPATRRRIRPEMIPLRPWFDASSPHAEDPAHHIHGRKSTPAATRWRTRLPVEPSMQAEAKTPPPGSTVVIEQAVARRPRSNVEAIRTVEVPRGGGGGGRGGGRPPLPSAFSDHEFRELPRQGSSERPPEYGDRRDLLDCGRFARAGGYTIYLFDMSDRVLTSRSTDTLVMLTGIVIIAIGAHVLMDVMRFFILMRLRWDRSRSGRAGAERHRQMPRGAESRRENPDAGRPAAPSARSSPGRYD